MNLGTVRVFVSSTWLDLQPERQAVEAALQRMRETKFNGMEYFGSRDESTLEASLDEVDRSQAYVGIFGGRYGSGITEAEYRRARERELPCFIYFQDPPVESGEDADAKRRLAELKEEFRHHTCSGFHSPEDLAAKATADLHNWLVDTWLPPHKVGNALVRGLASLRADYATRIRNFLTEYLGTPDRPVPFGGRHAQLASLDAWVDDPDAPPYLALAAPAGRGKSALLAWWGRQTLARNDTAVVFFPVSIRFRTNLASVVFASLAARLAALYDEELPGGADSSAEMWRALVGDYLQRPLPDGRRLVLIVDGIDEAADFEPGPDLFPLDPPSGLRVVVSARYRAGDTDAGGWLRTLGWDRPGLARGLDLDLLTIEGVTNVLQRLGDPLARLAADAGIAGELHRLSEGDPLALRLYVEDLQERGEEALQLSTEDLAAIQPGLRGFFDRWWDEQRRLWGQGRSPLMVPAVRTVLSLLACALGPLSRDDLLDLAPEDVELNSFTLADVLNPLRRFVIGDGRQQGYVFSHPRLGDYFFEQLSGRERRQWEDRFLHLGEETLASLDGGRLPPGEASPYVVQYYGAHLERADPAAAALAALVSDGWRQAWEHLEGSYAGFLSDVNRAWRAAERANEGAAEAGERTPFLGTEERCALCHASVTTLASNIPIELMKALVENGLWTPRQALAYAQVSQDAAAALPALAPLLRHDQMGEALEAAWDIPASSLRLEALYGLIPVLPGALKTEVLRQVMEEAVRALRSDDPLLARAFSTFLLPEERRRGELRQTLVSVEAIEETVDRIAALAGVAGILPGDLRDEALGKATEDLRSLQGHQALLGPGETAFAPWDRLGVFMWLGPLATEDLLSEILRLMDGVEDPSDRLGMLWALAVIVPKQLREGVVQRAHAAVRDMDEEAERADGLSLLLPLLSGDLEAEALQQILDFARKIGDEERRALALLQLAPQLDEPRRRQVLKEALGASQAIEDSWNSVGSIWAGPKSPIEFGDFWSAQVALFDELKHLPDEAGAMFEKLGKCLRALSEAFEGVMTMPPGLATQLPEDLFPEALAAVRSMATSSDRKQALSALAPRLPERLLREALEIARAMEEGWDRAEGLSCLVPHLPESLRRQVVLEVLREARVAGWAQQNILVDLAPHLPDELSDEALGLAHALEDESGSARLDALLTLAPHLPGPSRRETLLEVFEMVDPSDWERVAEVLPRLAADLPERLPEAVKLASAIPDPNDRAEAFAKLAPHLPERHLLEALESLRAIDDAEHRAEALADLAPYLSESQKAEALKAVREAANPEALLALIPHLHESLRSEALPEALKAAKATVYLEDGTSSLSALLPYLSEELAAEALRELQRVRWRDYCNGELATIAPHLPEPLKTEVLRRIGRDLPRCDPEELAVLAPQLPEPLKTEALRRVLDAVPTLDCIAKQVVVMWRLTPHLPEPLEAEALAAMQAVARMRSLEDADGIAGWPEWNQTVESGLHNAIEGAQTTGSPEVVSEVLSALAAHCLAEVQDWERIADFHTKAVLPDLVPHLPDSSLAEALEKALALEADRCQTLASLAPRLAALPHRKLYPIWQRAIDSLESGGRSDLLRFLGASAPVIAALGGEEAAAETARAIIDVGRWWP